MRVSRRRPEQGQALILALALLGLLAVFSVSVVKLGSASLQTASSVRQAAYRDGLAEAGAEMGRKLVKDGLGCTHTAMGAQFKAENVTVTVSNFTLTQAPGPCAPPNNGGPTTGTAPGDYLLCVVTSASTGTYRAAVQLSAAPMPTDPDVVNIDIVHFSYGTDARC